MMSDFGNLMAYAEAMHPEQGPTLQERMAKAFDAQAKEAKAAAEKAAAEKDKAHPASAKR
jgi:hypothetical protein